MDVANNATDIKAEPRPQPGIEDDPDYKMPCTNPGHHPPSHICIPQGKQYRHICPACGETRIIKPINITF